jgi:uncharacterized membrane protein (UPF0127 family)
VSRRHGIQTLRREDGRIICEKVKVADTWLRRLRGLLFRRALPPDEGCVLRPSFSIHTAFMQFPLDVVFLDHDLVVQKISANVRPFHATSSRGAREVVELRAGECARRGLAVGDRVAWASYQATDMNVAGPYHDTASTAHRSGQILIASRDSRFVKLMRFLLESRGFDSIAEVAPDALVQTLESLEAPATVVLDAGASTADALATASIVRARMPDVTLLLAAERDAVTRAPAGTRLYDKWTDTDTLVDLASHAVEQPLRA